MTASTPEQIESDRTLHEAIVGCLRAYGWDEPPTSFVSGWVVGVGMVGTADDGDDKSSVAFLSSRPTMPLYARLGLADALREASIRAMFGADD